MPDTTNPIAGPAKQDLRILGQILTRVDKLSAPSKVWLREQLAADSEST